jgi:hypothetical protein
MNKVQRTLIDGKPHFGLFFGRSISLTNLVQTDWMADPSVIYGLEILRKFPAKDDCSLEIRDEQIIFRPGFSSYDPLSLVSFLSIKFLIWGRAYKIMRLLSKRTKRTKKIWLSGRRKRIRK